MNKKNLDLISTLENYHVKKVNFILFFLLICFIRNFLECFIGTPKIIGPSINIKLAIIQLGALYNLEWITLYLYIVIIIFFLIRINLLAILRISLIFFNIIIIVPIINYFFYFPNGCKIDYLYTLSDYLNSLLYFFNPFVDIKVCAGIRIEVFISVILIFAYIFVKTRNITKSLTGSILLYFLAVSSMSFPVFVLLGFFPFCLNKFDNFVNVFFFSTSFLDSFLNKFSIMIFVLLIPALLIIYKIHYGNKKFLYLLKNLLSFDSIIIFISILLGFISSYGIPNIFSSHFNIFFLIFLFIISSLVNIYLNNDFKTQRAILFVLLFIFSLAISFYNLFVYLILFVLISVFFITSQKNVLLHVFICIFLFVILYVFGLIITPSNMPISMLNYPTIIMLSILYYYNKKRRVNY